MASDAIIYRGNIESVAKELEKHQDALNQAYLEVFGPENYQKLADIADRTLTSESFFNSPEEYNQRFKFGPRIKKRDSSKFIFLSDDKTNVDKTGKFKKRDANVCGAFYVSEDSFLYSGSKSQTDNILATYIHEYDHFALMALQNPTLYLAHVAITEHFKTRVNSFNDVMRIAVEALEKKLVPVEFAEKIAEAVSACNLYEVWENSTRVLDSMVLDPIGIDVTPGFRGMDRTYMAITIPGTMGKKIGIPSGGDPFKHLTDTQVINSVLHWQDTFKPTPPTEFVNNVYDSLKDVKMNIVSIAHMFDYVSGKVIRKGKQKQKKGKDLPRRGKQI